MRKDTPTPSPIGRTPKHRPGVIPFSDKNYLSVRAHRYAYHLLVLVAGLKRGAYPFRLGKQIGREERSREEEEFERGFHKTAIERPRPTDRNTRLLACPRLAEFVRVEGATESGK